MINFNAFVTFIHKFSNTDTELETESLWATLAARSKTQDLKPGCWRRAWDGRGGVRPLERRRSLRAESLRLRTSGALSSFLKSTCVPPGPFQEVSGPRSQSGELETWPQPWLAFRQVFNLI